MPDFSIKQGDTAPSYVVALTDARPTTWDLAGSTVKFTMRRLRDGEVVIDHRDCTILDPTARTVRFDWISADTEDAGLCLAEFEVTLANSRIETFPDNGHLLIDVRAQADDVELPETLCNVDDVAGYLDNLTADEALFATRVLIPRVEAQAETFLHHTLVRKERTQSGIAIYPDEVEIALRFTPVLSVSAVSLDGDALSQDSWTVKRTSLLINALLAPSLDLALPPPTLAATYIGGFSDQEASLIKPTLLTRIARLLTKYRDKALGTDRVSAESYTVEYLSEGFTDDELAMLDPYRSRGGGITRATRDPSWESPYSRDVASWT